MPTSRRCRANVGLGQRLEAARAGLTSANERPLDADLTPIKGLKEREAAQERALARAGRAEDRLDLAAPDAERHAPQDSMGAVLAVDVDRLDDGHLRGECLELGDHVGIEDLAGERRIALLGRQVPAHRAALPKPRSTPNREPRRCEAQT